jgi:hypothetical protein
LPAVNDGGESFASETLSAGFSNDSVAPVLIVNGFDRVCGPSIFKTPEMAGIAWWNDKGIPYKTRFSHTGNQIDFNPKSKYLDDESPGWGASYADIEGVLETGNSFDFVVKHGASVLASGYSFISTSDEAFEQSNFDMDKVSVIDWIAGEEKTTQGLMDGGKSEFSVYSHQMINRLTQFLNNGGNLFLSGAYIGSDLQLQPDSLANQFAKDKLHFKWQTGHASKGGKIVNTDNGKDLITHGFEFNTDANDSIYKVESPDALLPVGSNALSVLQYDETKTTAGVAYKGHYSTVVLGFPFETITSQSVRNELMKNILQYFKKQ